MFVFFFSFGARRVQGAALVEQSLKKAHNELVLFSKRIYLTEWFGKEIHILLGQSE